MTIPTTDELINGLPGADFFRAGMADLENSVESLPALLVATAAHRLKETLTELHLPQLPNEPERRLYALLSRENPQEAYSQYNAHLRRLVRFCRALESRAHRS